MINENTASAAQKCDTINYRFACSSSNSKTQAGIYVDDKWKALQDRRNMTAEVMISALYLFFFLMYLLGILDTYNFLWSRRYAEDTCVWGFFFFFSISFIYFTCILLLNNLFIWSRRLAGRWRHESVNLEELPFSFTEKFTKREKRKKKKNSIQAWVDYEK